MSMGGLIYQALFLVLCILDIVCSNLFRKFFLCLQVVVFHAFTDWCSCKYSVHTLCRSPELSLSADLFSPVLCKLKYFTQLSLLRKSALILLRSCSLQHTLKILKNVCWDNHVYHVCFPPHNDHFSVLPMCNVLKTIVSYIMSICWFRQADKFCSYYYILIRNKSLHRL